MSDGPPAGPPGPGVGGVTAPAAAVGAPERGSTSIPEQRWPATSVGREIARPTTAPTRTADRSVLFDSQIFCIEPHGGISRYFAELLGQPGIFARSRMQISTPYRWVLNPAAARIRPSLRVPRPRMLRHQEFLLPGSYPTQRMHRYDLVHHTFYHPRFLGAFHAGKVVSTIHDMIPEHFPEQFGSSAPHLAKDQYVAASDALICVSEYTRKDVSEHYKIPPERMRVIPLAPSPAFYELPTAPHPPWSWPYVLFVGQRAGYKNFAALTTALSRSASLNDLHIVAAGGPPLTAQEHRDLAAKGLLERVTHLRPDDEVLRGLYANAVAFVCPSLYEGFGLPALEAMASKCPVIASNRASLPEVVGDAALLFDPAAVDQLTTLLEKVAFDTEVQVQLGERGQKRALTFSWGRTAQLTADLYAELAG